MSHDARRAGFRPWLQLGLATAAALAIAMDDGLPLFGFAGLVALVAVWPPAVAWRPARVGAVLAVYLPFAVAWLLFLVVYLRVAHALGVPVSPQPMLQQLAEQGLTTPDFAFLLLGIVVVAPLTEELLFRGYLFTALLGAVPGWLTHLLTAGAFGLLHGPHYAVPIGVLGLLFGFLRHRHAAMLPAIFAHGLHNGLTVSVTVAWPGHLELLYPR